jgi:hypothetical protein
MQFSFALSKVGRYILPPDEAQAGLMAKGLSAVETDFRASAPTDVLYFAEGICEGTTWHAGVDDRGATSISQKPVLSTSK